MFESKHSGVPHVSRLLKAIHYIASFLNPVHLNLFQPIQVVHKAGTPLIVSFQKYGCWPAIYKFLSGMTCICVHIYRTDKVMLEKSFWSFVYFCAVSYSSVHKVPLKTQNLVLHMRLFTHIQRLWLTSKCHMVAIKRMSQKFHCKQGNICSWGVCFSF